MAGRDASRRSVVRGAAWAVPVIAATAAAPVFAASGQTVTTAVTSACKSSGGTKIYTFTIDFCTTVANAVTITVTSINVNGVVLTNLNITESGTTSYTIPPNTCVTLHVTGQSTNASSNNATVNYTATPGSAYSAFTDTVPNC